MAYVSIPQPVENIRGAVNYISPGKGHNGKPRRDEYFTAVNMGSWPDYASQFEKVFAGASAKAKIMAYTMFISFSRKELDPDVPENAYLALKMGEDFLEQFGKGRQGLVAVQKDGNSGLLHVHIITGNIHPVTFKGFEGQGHTKVMLFNPDGSEIKFTSGKHAGEQAYYTESETSLARAERIKNEAVNKYITQDFGENHGKAYSHYEKKLREENKAVEAENAAIDKEAQDADSGNGRKKPDKKKKEPAYIWKDDLRERIDKCASETKTWEEFVSRLKAEYRVELSERKYVTYTLTDTEKAVKQMRRDQAAKLVKKGRTEKEAEKEAAEMTITPKLKARSRSLGSVYTRESVESRLGQEIEKQKTAEQAAETALRRSTAEAVQREIEGRESEGGTVTFGDVMKADRSRKARQGAFSAAFGKFMEETQEGILAENTEDGSRRSPKGAGRETTELYKKVRERIKPDDYQYGE